MFLLVQIDLTPGHTSINTHTHKDTKNRQSWTHTCSNFSPFLQRGSVNTLRTNCASIKYTSHDDKTKKKSNKWESFSFGLPGLTFACSEKQGQQTNTNKSVDCASPICCVHRRDVNRTRLPPCLKKHLFLEVVVSPESSFTWFPHLSQFVYLFFAFFFLTFSSVPLPNKTWAEFFR